jgi:hypothetical protein
MIETFHIHASRIQFILLASGYCMIGLLAWAYIDGWILRSCCSGLCALLILSEFLQYRDQKDLQLRLNLNENSITIKQGGQSYIYRKNKVYPARWFAILRLVGKPNNRTLFLNSDRFKSVLDYQAIRYSLIQMERSTDVA